MKTKLMLTTDWAPAGTGFSEEAKNIAFRLAQTGEYEVTWLGYNYVGHPIDLPDSVFPDLPQKGATVKSISGFGPDYYYGLEGFKYYYDEISPDFFMSMGDPKNFQPYTEYRKYNQLYFPYITYTTLDGVPIKPLFKEVFRGVNMPIAMTEWAMIEYQKADIPMAGYIHHGVDWQWMATSKESKFRARRRYGIDDDTVLFIDWNSNQYRKRTDALLQCWKAFNPRSKNAKLLMLCDWDMSDSLGWNIEEYCVQYDIPRDTIISPLQLTGREKKWARPDTPIQHRELAQMGDVLVSCTSGEGFGKVFLEALSLGIPVIAPNYSALPEVCERGSILIDPYSGPAGRYRLQDKICSVDRAVVDQEKFVDAMIRLYDHPDEREELGAQGREWSKNFDYDTRIIPEWISMLGSVNPDVIYAQEMLKGI